MTACSSSNPSSKIDLSKAFAAALNHTDPADPKTDFDADFFMVMFESIHEGVIFVDQNRKIGLWNRMAENISGIPSQRIVGETFDLSLIGVSQEESQQSGTETCPLAACLQTRQRVERQYRIVGRSLHETKVDVAFHPVLNRNEEIVGSVILVNDSSVQTDLKRKLQDLFVCSMVDPLTQVFNRSEFDRVLGQFLRAKQVSDFKCSLIICDIDFFKAINDNYNHHTGDQCLIAFAEILKRFAGPNDLVARYGGEEFVMLCGHCDQATAARRAEELRVTLTKTAMPILGGKCLTASFGVAELQLGESATDFFVRADSAMIKAKETGRNRVVESGAIVNPVNVAPLASSASGLVWKHAIPRNPIVCEEFVTTTPLTMLVEKLRGYVLEMDAEVLDVESEYAKILLQVEDDRKNGRKGDFLVEIEFQNGPPKSKQDNDRRKQARPQTFIRVIITEAKKKWFGQNVNDLVPLALRELRRYFMISDESAKLGIDRAVTKSTRK